MRPYSFSVKKYGLLAFETAKADWPLGRGFGTAAEMSSVVGSFEGNGKLNSR